MPSFKDLKNMMLAAEREQASAEAEKSAKKSAKKAEVKKSEADSEE